MDLVEVALGDSQALAVIVSRLQRAGSALLGPVVKWPRPIAVDMSEGRKDNHDQKVEPRRRAEDL